MTPPRLTHKSTDNLPAEAQRLLVAGFRARKTYSVIAREMAAAGFGMSSSTIARYALDWRTRERNHWALKVALSESGSMDTILKVSSILDSLDLAPGWKLRARQRTFDALKNYLSLPSTGNMRDVHQAMVAYKVAQIISAAPQVLPQGGDAAVSGEADENLTAETTNS